VLLSILAQTAGQAKLVILAEPRLKVITIRKERNMLSESTRPKNPQKFRYSFWILVALLLSKIKVVLAVLGKIKGLGTAASAIVSILAYWWTANLGLAGAAGLVALIFVHEMGHVLVLRYYGIPASAPVFIPFAGALIAMRGRPRNVKDEAVMALGGPVLGSIGALVCLLVFLYCGSPLWLWLAAVGFMLNLFNLVPLSPLDGGRIAGAIWRGFWFIGFAAMALLAIVEESWFLGMLALFGIGEINRRYMTVPTWTWCILGALALGLQVYLHGLESLLYLVAALALVLTLLFWVVTIGTPIVRYIGNRMREAERALAARDADDEKSTNHIESSTEQTSEAEEKSDVREATASEKEEYFQIPLWQRIAIGIVYLGLAGLLTWAVLWILSTGILKHA
jgi:Zn-dependent protease